MTSPHLPPELEEIVFLIAYENDHHDAQNLILVCKRVFDWLIPHIFSIVTLGENQCHPIKFNETAFQKHGHHVRHLWLWSPNTGRHLHLFPNIIDLVWWDYTNRYLSALVQLPLLTRLFVPFDRSLMAAYLKNVTHLNLSYISDEPLDPDVDNIYYFPKLTHLCVDRRAPASSVLRLLLVRDRCPNLRVVVVWSYRNSEVPVLDPRISATVDDERLVMVRVDEQEDWERRAKGEAGTMWEFAEGVVEERRKTRRALT